MQCCNKPKVSALNDIRTSINEEGRFHTEPWVNKICLNCYSHWYGAPESPKFYTRKEWDAWINEIDFKG
jgi:hypothetical protein